MPDHACDFGKYTPDEVFNEKLSKTMNLGHSDRYINYMVKAEEYLNGQSVSDECRQKFLDEVTLLNRRETTGFEWLTGGGDYTELLPGFVIDGDPAPESVQIRISK